MMKLIRTHDGLIGIQHKDGTLNWCDDNEHAIRVAHTIYRGMGHTMDSMRTEITTAIDDLAQHNKTIAEFGVYGNYMYPLDDDAGF